MEIVTEPVLNSGLEAAQFVSELLLILRAIGSCDGNLAEGSLRVDANVSVAHEHSKTLGVRSEVKNVNGLRFLSRAVDYEIGRHIRLLEQNIPMRVETRVYNVAKK